MKQSLLVIPFIALLALFFPASTVADAKPSPPVPQVQFFHASISGATLPDNGTTVQGTITFTTNQSGALHFTSEDSTIVPPIAESTCVTSDVDTVTTILLLDGVQIASTSHQGLPIPNSTINGSQAYTCALANIGLVTTHAVNAGQHTVTLEYITSTNPNPPSQTGNMVNGGGTLGLIVATPATSD
jgi:hypothetical protein